MTIDEIKRRSLPHFQALGVHRASLFGSMARGEATEKSDLDFLVEFPDSWSLLDVAHLKVVLEDEFQRTVDVVDFDVIKPRIRESVLRDQVPML